MYKTTKQWPKTMYKKNIENWRKTQTLKNSLKSFDETTPTLVKCEWRGKFKENNENQLTNSIKKPVFKAKQFKDN